VIILIVSLILLIVVVLLFYFIFIVTWLCLAYAAPFRIPRRLVPSALGPWAPHSARCILDFFFFLQLTDTVLRTPTAQRKKKRQDGYHGIGPPAV